MDVALLDVSSRHPGLVIELCFEDGVLTDYGAAVPIPEPKYPFGGTLCQMWNRLLDNYGHLVWLGQLPLVLLLRRHSVLMAELLLMFAITLNLVHLPVLGLGDWLQRVQQVQFLPWGLAMFSTSLTAFAWAYFFERSRLKIACPVCDYRLVGNESGRCPECGTPVPEEVRQRLAMTHAWASPQPVRQ